MRTKWIYGLIPAVCLALSACGMGKDKEPIGQVVATVDGEEITLMDLRAELAGVNTPDPKARKAAEQQALQMIVNRKIVAKAAEEQKLDKTPDFAIQEQRAMENLRASALQKKIVESVPEPTREEANRFIAANPNIFAERKVFTVDQIRVAAPRDAKSMAEFEPLKTFEEVEALLKAKGMNYQRGADRIDAVGSNPKLIEAIAALPPGEVFVIPSGAIVLINRVRETQVRPFTGEPAVKYAIQVMKAQRTQEALAKQFGGMIRQAQSTVKYNKQYQPAAPKAQKAPASKPAQATPKV